MQNQYKVYPTQVDSSAKYSLDQSIADNDWLAAFIGGLIFLEIIAIIVAIYSGGGSVWIYGLFIIAAFFIINKLNNDADDATYTKKKIESQKDEANMEAEFYTQKFNSILSKSEEIVHQILPYCEESAKACIKAAKIEFSENVYSPFWSEIETASKFLACYKEALNQLCMNSEIYNHALENKHHNFPIPFPFTINVSISQTIEDYKTTIRKAQSNATFSIIWEQRRNSEILIGGFRTLENAINNMSNEILLAISELKKSISSELSEMKYVQEERFRSFETSQQYLNEILNSMDNKLYYIQWKKKPLGTFHY